MSLKYLFTVKYSDGSIFEQNPEDVSQIDPQKSAFYDVLESGKQVEIFSLSDGVNTYSINLKNAKFYLNNKAFIFPDKLPQRGDVMELVFFRRHTHELNGDEELSHEIIYYLGYKLNGEEKTIGIN